mgnify:CR=1 FL=1
MIATLKLSKRGVETAGFIPCWINQEEQPEPEEIRRKKGNDDVDTAGARFLLSLLQSAIFLCLHLGHQGQNLVHLLLAEIKAAALDKGLEPCGSAQLHV